MAPGAPIVVRPSSPDDGRIGEGWDMDLEMVLSAACSLDGDESDRLDAEGARHGR